MKTTLRPYQERAFENVKDHLRRGVRRVLLVSPTGCHRAGQPIMLHDGRVVPVESIEVGDRLMGPDGTPRTVLQLCRGVDRMFRIVPVKGEPFVVNGDHVLSLVRCNDGSKHAGGIVDVTVRDYIGWNSTMKHVHKLFRVGVDFPEREAPPIDPYFLGVLLGDGCISGGKVTVTKPDEQIRQACVEHGATFGLSVTTCDYGTSNGSVRHTFAGGYTRGQNPLNSALRGLGLWGTTAGTKFIPDAYKMGSSETRRQVLAGLLDTDGHLDRGVFDFISKSERLSNDLAFVARSLGLAAYVKACEKRNQRGTGGTYFRVCVSGHTNMVPTRIARKKAGLRRQGRDVLKAGFTVEDTGLDEPFYGFTLDGDHRYLLGDFTVSHNSGKGTLLASMIHGAHQKGSKTLFIVRGRQLVAEFSQRLTLQYGVAHGVLLGGKRASLEWPTQVASIDTLTSMIRRGRELPPADLIVADEADQSVSKGFMDVLAQYPRAAVIGPTATPIRADGKGLGRVFQAIVEAATPRELMDHGYLADFDGVAFESEMTDDELAAASKSEDGAQRIYSGLSESRREKRRGNIVEAWHQHLGEGSRQHDGERRTRPAATVGFPITCDDSRDIVARFNAERLHGAPICVAVHIDGDTPLAERERIHEMLRAGEVHLASSVGVLGRGVDWPVLEGCCLWRPTGSLAWHIQAIGRVLRPFAGKQRAMYLDHVGNFQKHGLPDDPRSWSLDDGVVNGGNGESLPSITTCKKCLALFRGEMCTRCGFVREQKEREILERHEAVAVDIRSQERKGASQDEQSLKRHLHTLIAIGRKKGEEPHWAKNVWMKNHRNKVASEELARIAAEVMMGRRSQP